MLAYPTLERGICAMSFSEDLKNQCQMHEFTDCYTEIENRGNTIDKNFCLVHFKIILLKKLTGFSCMEKSNGG